MAPTAPEAGSRGEAQQRTRDLIDGLGGAARHERSAIRAEVVVLHLGMATTVARRLGPAGELDDLIQWPASDWSRRSTASTASTPYAGCARATMTGLLQHHLRDHGWSVRPSIGLVEAFDRYDPTQVSYVYFAWMTAGLVPDPGHDVARHPAVRRCASFGDRELVGLRGHGRASG